MSRHSKVDVDVVIVGAGPTGMTAASLLATYGVRSLVLDRWPDVYPQPRAVHLDDEVYRILGRLGLADDFAAISRPGLGLRLLDRDHKVLAEFRRDRTVGVHGYPQANMFDQPDLERLLRTHAQEQPEITLLGNVEVTAADQLSVDQVRVTFQDRQTQAVDTVTAAFVLGCDGANSTVRTSIGATMTDLGFEQRWLVVDVATDHDLRAWEGVHQVCDTQRAATYMRIGEHRHRWEFRLLDGETAADFSSPQGLQPLIAPWTASIPMRDIEIRRVAEYTFRASVADAWRDRRIFLLGDAAHLTPPFIGQGMGAGLRDALNLTWKIAGVLTGDLDEAWLDTYEAERKPHATTLIKTAVWIGRAMTQGGRLGDLARRVISPHLDRVPGLRTQIVDAASPALRGHTVALHARRTGLAGKQCPNATTPDGERFDLRTGASRFVLLASGPVDQFTRGLVERRGGVVIDIQPGSPLHDWMTTKGDRAALVRPDGTVLASGSRARPLVERMPTFRPVTQQTTP